MSAPRVQYVPVLGDRSGSTPTWPGAWHGRPSAHRRHGIAWRLLGANNRELGRSPESYPEGGSCRLAFQRLQDDVGQSDRVVVAAAGGGSWVWRLALEGTVVAVSSRTYQRQRECDYNLARFVALLPMAEADRLPDGLSPVPTVRRLEVASS